MKRLKKLMSNPTAWTSLGLIAVAIFLLSGNDFFKITGAILLLLGSIFFFVRRVSK